MKQFLFFVFISVSISFSQDASWGYYGNMDKPVAGGDIFTDYNNFYIIGGYSDSLQRTVNWIQNYNVYDQSWNIDSMSIPREGLVAENYNGFAYFYGGINDESSSISGIEKWQNTFTDNAIIEFNENFNRNYSTGHIIGDNFYIIGGNSLPGTSSNKIPYIVEYNLLLSKVTYQTDSLFISGDLPEQQMSEAIGSDIYIFGGVVNGISQDIYKFNTIDHTYSKLPIQLLEPRAGGRAILSTERDKIYIIGGYNENLEVLSSVEIFYIFGDQFDIVQAPNINEARYNFMTADFEGQLFIFGGYNSEKNVVKSIEVLYENAVVDIDESQSLDITNQFKLLQNYPNPFNPVTTIEYTLPAIVNSEKSKGFIPSGVEGELVQLKIYDLLGREVTTLVNEIKKPGVYQVTFNANNLSSGIYYYQLICESFIQTKKMILIK